MERVGNASERLAGFLREAVERSGRVAEPKGVRAAGVEVVLGRGCLGHLTVLEPHLGAELLDID